MISVIIPIYNTGKLLNRMLKSIQEQTYRDLEIILVNDGSTDESEQECKKAAVNDGSTASGHPAAALRVPYGQ